MNFQFYLHQNEGLDMLSDYDLLVRQADNLERQLDQLLNSTYIVPAGYFASQRRLINILRENAEKLK